MRVRRIVLLAATALLALLLTGSSGARPSATAGMHVTIEDPEGDSGAAPDLRWIHVGNDVVAGPIVFSITTPNREKLMGDDRLNIWLDTDVDPTTGQGVARVGADYVIFGDASGIAHLWRWTGRFLSPGPAPTLEWRQLARALRVSIHPSALGGTRAFNFVIVSESDPDDDMATGSFSVRSAPIVLAVERFAVTPRVARAGALLTAVLLPRREDIHEALREGDPSCVVRVGRARVPARKGWGDAGAFCRFVVPRTARGKAVTVTLSVAFGGRQVSRTYRSRVR